jgi:hypothetical protein
MRTLILAVALTLFASACPKSKPPAEGTEKTCFDKVDNDSDGKTDCQDDQCKRFCDGAQMY